MTNPNRTGGFLTPADRTYLLGQSDVEPKTQRERTTRSRIRERTRQALVDFTLLFERLEDRDVGLIFDEDIDQDEYPISDGAISIVGLLYRDSPEMMEAVVEAAIKRELKRQGWLSSPSVKIQENRERDVDQVVDQVEQSGEIWPEEAALLQKHGEFDITNAEDRHGLTQHRTGRRDDGIPSGIDDPEEAVQFIQLPAQGSGESDREERRKGLQAVVDYLKREGRTTVDELRERVFPLYPGGFDGPDEWDRQLLRPALGQLPQVYLFINGNVEYRGNGVEAGAGGDDREGSGSDRERSGDDEDDGLEGHTNTGP